MILLGPIACGILSNKNINKIPNFKVSGRTESEDAWEMSDLSFPHSCFNRFLWVNESPIDHSKTILRNKGAAKLFSQRMSLLSDEAWWIEAVPRKVLELQMGSLHPHCLSQPKVGFSWDMTEDINFWFPISVLKLGSEKGNQKCRRHI